MAEDYTNVLRERLDDLPSLAGHYPVIHSRTAHLFAAII